MGRWYQGILVMLVSVISLASCSSQNGFEMLGKARPAIERKDVSIMQVAPANAEAIAKLRAEFSYGVRETDDEKLVYAIERLRSQAAGLGANVIVLSDVKFRQTAAGLVTAGIFDGQTSTGVEAQPTPVVWATAYYLKKD